MGSVVALDEFRQEVGKTPRKPARPARPSIVGTEVWGRDYREVEAVVYGLLQARGLVAHHVGRYDQAFDAMCTVCLDAAYQVKETGHARLKEAIKPLKEWILDEMTEDNKRDLSWALVILDLIEKSPARRSDR